MARRGPKPKRLAKGNKRKITTEIEDETYLILSLVSDTGKKNLGEIIDRLVKKELTPTWKPILEAIRKAQET